MKVQHRPLGNSDLLAELHSRDFSLTCPQRFRETWKYLQYFIQTSHPKFILTCTCLNKIGSLKLNTHSSSSLCIKIYGRTRKLYETAVSNCSSLLFFPSSSVQKLPSYIVNDCISFLSRVPHLVPSDLSESGSSSLLKNKNLHKIHNQ